MQIEIHPEKEITYRENPRLKYSARVMKTIKMRKKSLKTSNFNFTVSGSLRAGFTLNSTFQGRNWPFNIHSVLCKFIHLDYLQFCTYMYVCRLIQAEEKFSYFVSILPFFLFHLPSFLPSFFLFMCLCACMCVYTCVCVFVCSCVCVCVYYILPVYNLCTT